MFKRVFRLRAPRETVDDDLDDELRFHFDRAVDDLVTTGLTRDAARREALRRFGDLQFHRHNIQDLGRRRAAMLRRHEWIDIARQHVRYALRTVRRSPGFTAAVVVTLGLGIGANATMFGIVDRILRREGFGFILTDDGDRVYFHRNAVKEGLDFDRLEEADRVALNVEPGREGLQATTVVAPPPRGR